MAETVILSVQKALTLLDILAFRADDGQGMTLSQLAASLDQRPTTVRNILKTMIRCGYVAQDAAGRYLPGEKCQSLRQMGGLTPGSGMYNEIQERLIELNRQTGEAVVYAVMLNGRRKQLFQCESPHLIKVDFETMESDDLYTRATGRVLLAYADSRAVDRAVTRSGYPGELWEGAVDRDGLERCMSAVRDAGCAVCYPGEEIAALAVPVHIHPFGSIGFYAPLYRCGAGDQQRVLEQMREAALLLEMYADTLTPKG